MINYLELPIGDRSPEVFRTVVEIPKDGTQKFEYDKQLHVFKLDRNLHSPVHYPEPLIFTTTKDDRVGPVHARKFAARMEEFHEPFFYDEITEGGHGVGADNKQEARSLAENYTYLMMKLLD